MTTRELSKDNAIKNVGKAETCIELIQAVSPYLPQGLYEIARYKAGVIDSEVKATNQ